MRSQEIEMKRRQFLAKKGDSFAIAEGSQTEKSQTGSGAAQKLAKDLAINTKVDKANIRGLESLAWSTDSVADILDYIRMRVGRDYRNTGWAQGQIGINLAEQLEALRNDANEFFTESNPAQEDDLRRLHLDLCREFIKHLTALYEFYKKPEAHDDESKQL
ncbi:hypothetical protein L0337_10740 [candidate division KSB1 bacterium]|nr:hypothetical protein [candidate division KSB1 bacterium]